MQLINYQFLFSGLPLALAVSSLVAFLLFLESMAFVSIPSISAQATVFRVILPKVMAKLPIPAMRIIEATNRLRLSSRSTF